MASPQRRLNSASTYVEPEWTAALEGVFEQLQWDRNDDQHEIPASAVSGVKDEEILLRDDLL